MEKRRPHYDLARIQALIADPETRLAEECGICGRRSARLVQEDRAVTVRGRTFVIRADEFYRCDHCAESYYTNDQAKVSQTKLDALRREAGDLLQPDEIKAVRCRLGLSQAKLEAILGLGKNTVVRWEKGTVLPSRTADRLLRLLDRDPSALDFLARLRISSSRPKQDRATRPAQL